MRKLISKILLVCITLSLFTFSTVKADEGLTPKQSSLLEVTEVINSEYALDAKLTKAQFVQMIANVACGNVNMNAYINYNAPIDVDEYSDYAEDVNELYRRGFLTIDNYGRFFPDNNITAREAISIALRTMGYSEEYVKKIAKNDVSFAMKRNLTKGMNVPLNDELNVYSAYNLIYNMLYTDVSELHVNPEGKLLFMTERLDMYEINGVVDDDGVISLEGKTKLSSEYISVDGRSFINKCGYNDLLGQRIHGIYKVEDDEDILVAICENERKNKVTTLLSYDITKLENRTYYYFNEEISDREKSIKVPNDAVIIYNEKVLELEDNFNDSMLLPKNGRIRFYDNDNNGKTDILRVENFEVGIVKTVDVEKKKVYVNNSRIFDLENKEMIIEYKDGSYMELEAVKKDNVVLYLESLDGSVAKLVVSDSLYSDTITSKSSENITTVLTEAGAKYEFSKYAIDTCGAPEVGVFYKIYLDAFGRVAYYEKDVMPNEYTYGCISKLIYSEELEPEEYQIKIFTQYGDEAIYKFAKKITLINEDGTKDSWKREVFPPQLTYRGVVRFKVNTDNEVYSIELPHKKGERSEKEDRLQYIVDSYTNDNANDYYPSPSADIVNYGGAAIIDANTIVFHCPEDPTKIDDYGIGGVDSFRDGNYCNIYAFGTNSRTKKAECVCLFEVFSDTITSESPAIVKAVSLVYDEEEEEVAYKITLLKRGDNEEDVYMLPDKYDNEVFATGNGVTSPLKMAVGDIIYYVTNGKYIQKASIIYDADHTVTDERGKTITGAIAGTKISYFDTENLLCNPFYISDRGGQNSGSSTAWKFYTGGYKIMTGWIYSIDDGYIQITTQNPAYGYDPDKTIEDGFVTQIYSYGQEKFLTTTEPAAKNKKNVRAGKVSDLKSYLDYGKDCSRIVWVQYLYANRFINIINN